MTTAASDTGTATTPAAPPSVGFFVARLGYIVSSQLSEALKPLGIEPHHFGVMRALSVNSGETQKAIAASLFIHPNRMVALIDELEARKLARRLPHPSDRRAHTVMLTPSGENLLHQAFRIALGIEAELCADLKPEERGHLLSLLSRLRSGDPAHAGVHPGLAGPNDSPDT